MKAYLYKLATDQVKGGGHSVLQLILLGLSLIYKAIVVIWQKLYSVNILKSFQFSVPVISIGNLTVGGTGKTPFVEAVLLHLKDKNKQGVIVARGYQRLNETSLQNDEIVMLEDNLQGVKVLAGVNRAKMIRQHLKNETADCFILDDGFQHLSVKRDLDIVLLDTTNPFGNRYLMPRGILREPTANLKRADILVLTKTNLARSQKEKVRKYLEDFVPGKVIVESAHTPESLVRIGTNEEVPFSFLENKNICAVSAIGDPQSFEDLIQSMGATILKSFCYLDHYHYKRSDLESIIEHCLKHHIRHLVTTQKDAVKIKPLLDAVSQPIELYVLKIKLTLTKNQHELYQRIDCLL